LKKTQQSLEDFMKFHSRLHDNYDGLDSLVFFFVAI